MSRRGERAQSRELLWIAAAAAVVLTVALYVATRVADPAPPSTLAISTASKGAPYHSYATQYAPLFARNNVRLDVRESGGSMDNIARLRDPRSGVGAGFVQGGLTSANEAPELLSVGRVAYEPLWVFHNGGLRLQRLADLAGRRVLVGPAGGGTNGLALRLLAANGITAANATLINRELPDYVDLLAKGEADAGFLVLAPEARTVQRLLRTPEVRLMSFANADAYVQKFPFLSRLDLREGVVDLGARIPPQDVTLIATSAALLVRRDAHPALVNLLAQAVADVHGRPAVDARGEARLFHRAGEFPTAADPEFPMSDDARRVYRAGAPFLQRYMPFWMATMIDRLVVSLVVLLPLLIPAMRFAPQIYRWRVRRRILRWYAVLKDLESGLEANPTVAERQRALADLDRIEAAVNDTVVPLGFTDQLYQLKAYIVTVRGHLAGGAARPGGGPDLAVAAAPIQSRAVVQLDRMT